MHYVSKTYDIKEDDTVQRPVGHPTEPIRIVVVSGTVTVEQFVGSTALASSGTITNGVLQLPAGGAYGSSVKITATGGDAKVTIANLI